MVESNVSMKVTLMPLEVAAMFLTMFMTLAQYKRDRRPVAPRTQLLSYVVPIRGTGAAAASLRNSP
jgi:hypothetical protein